MLKRAVWISLVLVISCPVFAADDSLSENVEIRLSRSNWRDVLVTLPTQYIGPQNQLQLARDAKQGGRFHMVPLAVTYPGFDVWHDKKELEPNHSQHVFVLAQAGIASGIRAFAKRDAYPVSKGTRYGLKHFIANNKVEDAYYFEAPGEGADDVYIVCNHYDHTCHYYMQANMIALDFSLSEDSLPQWRRVVADFGQFIGKFYVKEVEWIPPSMGKLPSIIEVQIHEWSNSNSWRTDNLITLNVPLKYFGKDIYERADLKLPLDDYSVRLHVMYPSMDITNQDNSIYGTDSFPIGIFITNVPAQMLPNSFKGAQMKRDGSQVPIENMLALTGKNMGNSYGLDHYIMGKPGVIEHHIYALRSEDPEKAVRIECDYMKQGKDYSKTDDDGCKMRVAEKPNLGIEIHFAGQYIDQWQEVLNKSKALVDSLK